MKLLILFMLLPLFASSQERTNDTTFNYYPLVVCDKSGCAKLLPDSTIQLDKGADAMKLLRMVMIQMAIDNKVSFSIPERAKPRRN